MMDTGPVQTFAACRRRLPAAGVALVLVAGLALAGCSSLLPPASPQPAFYGLQLLSAGAAVARNAPPGVAGTTALDAARVLVVRVPGAAPGFDSAHIIYTQAPNRLQTFARHEWVDAPARMLAPLIVAALERNGSFSAVVLAPSAATGGLQLDTQLLRLQHEFATPPSRVRFVLRAQLIHTASRQVLATREFEHVAVSASEDAPGGVAAAQVAVNSVLGELALWCQDVVTAGR